MIVWAPKRCSVEISGSRWVESWRPSRASSTITRFPISWSDLGDPNEQPLPTRDEPRLASQFASAKVHGPALLAAFYLVQAQPRICGAQVRALAKKHPGEVRAAREE